MPRFAVNDGTGFQMNFEVEPGLIPETTLFLHGNCASTRWWYPAEQEWRRAAANQNWLGSLIYTDFRGCGQSSIPQNMSEVDMHRFADDNLALLKELNLGPVNIVGHSTGGIVAALMMAKAPKFFSKAVLLDSVGARGVHFDPSMIEAFEKMKTDSSLVAQVIGSTIHNNDSSTDFFRQIVVPDAAVCINSIGHHIIQALSNFDVRAELAQIPNEVLVLHGEFDTLLPMEGSRELAGLLPRGEFKWIEGRGHCLNAEDPAQFVSIMSEFLFPA